MESKLKTTLEHLARHIEESPPSTLLDRRRIVNSILSDLGYPEFNQKFWSGNEFIFGVRTHSEEIGIVVHLIANITKYSEALVNLNKVKERHPQAVGIVTDGLNYVLFIDQDGDGIFHEKQNRAFSIDDMNESAMNHLESLAFSKIDPDRIRKDFLFDDPIYATKDFLKGLIKGDPDKVREFLFWRSPNINLADQADALARLTDHIKNYEWDRHIELDPSIMKSFEIIRKILKDKGLDVSELDAKKNQTYISISLNDSSWTSFLRIHQSRRDGSLMRLDTLKGERKIQSGAEQSFFGPVEENFPISRPEDLYALSDEIVKAYKVRAELIRLEEGK